MKPKNLNFPFTWEERHPVITDRTLFVPKYYDAHQDFSFPGWEDPALFGREAPISIEYCTGNGAWIIEKARSQPEINWLAVEQKFERVRKIWSKMHNLNLTNLFIICGEALTFTRFYVPAESFDNIYVNFPDPWPKEKHAKNRIFQQPFINEVARASKKDAIMTVVTDDIAYKGQVCHEFLENPSWQPEFPAPYYKTEWEGYGTSYFDGLWREKGKTIHYMQFKR